jgi:hypothetical protein
VRRLDGLVGWLEVGADDDERVGSRDLCVGFHWSAPCRSGSRVTDGRH